jgi:ribose transport system substrate-binding protein
MGKIGKLVVVLVLCLLCLSTLAFGAGHGTNGKMLIGYTGFAPTLPFFINLAKGVEDKCKELGYEFIMLSPAETKAELQVQALDNAIIKGLDGLVISPIDARALGPSLDAAQKNGVRVVVVDAVINHPSVLAFIGTDNLEAAKMAGRYIVDKTKAKGDLLLLGGQIGHPNGDKRLKGVKETCEAAGMKVIVRPTDWMTDRAMQYATDELQADPNITAIFSCWDPGALAAKQAAKSLGLLDKVTIVGFDGDQSVFKSIKAGEIVATTRQQPYVMGQKGVEVLSKVFAGRSDFPKEVLIPGEMIDKTNVDQFLQ